MSMVEKLGLNDRTSKLRRLMQQYVKAPLNDARKRDLCELLKLELRNDTFDSQLPHDFCAAAVQRYDGAMLDACFACIIFETLANPIHIKKAPTDFTPNDIRTAYGCGIMGNIAREPFWQDDINHFLDLLAQVPYYIADQALSFMPRLATAQRISDTAPAISKRSGSWQARINAHEPILERA